MTPYEEMIAFYFELGRAISAWADVERALFQIYISCFTKHNYDPAGLTFFSIENFRSKMKAVDTTFRTKFDGTHHVADWDSIYKRLERHSSFRNHLVHYHTRSYDHAKPGRRMALIPTLSKAPRFRQKVPKPPDGSMFLRDIVTSRYQFTALAHGLELLFYRAKKWKTQLPTSLAQADDAPTMAQLTRQISTMLSEQP